MSVVTFIIVEWILTVVPGVLFVLRFGWPGRHQDVAMAWHVQSWTVVAVLETLGLLGLAFGIKLPMWVYAVIYGAGTGLVWWRLWLLIRTERKQRREG